MADDATTKEKNNEPSVVQPFKHQHQQMMVKGRAVRVRISENRNNRTVIGVIRIQDWNKKERMFRAFKFGGMCWGAALVAVFIPLLHFILVPGFLIAGPIVAYFIAGQESRVLGGEGICPSCHAPLILAPAGLHFPISDLCTRCQSSVKIESWDSSNI